MKRIYIVGLLALLGTNLARSASVDESRPLELQELWRSIEESNLSVLAAREGLAQAVAAKGAALSSLLPHARLEATQSRSQIVTVGLGLERFGLDRQSDPFSRFQAGVLVSMPLIDLEKIAALENARHAESISAYEFDVARKGVKLAGAQTFVACLRSQSGLTLARLSLERAEELRTLAASRVEGGVANAIDLRRAELERNAARQVVIERETALYASLQSLRLFFGDDKTRFVQVLEPSSFAFSAGAEDPPIPLDLVLSQRSDYLAALKEEERARVVLKAARWQRLPSLRAFGDWGHVTETALDGEEDQAWNVGLAFSVPLFEGGKIKADANRAKAYSRARSYMAKDSERRIRSEVMVSWERLRAADSRYVLGGEQEAVAREAYRIALERYSSGLGDNRELIESQLALAVAETQTVDLRCLLLLAKLDFASACGDVEMVFADAL